MYEILVTGEYKAVKFQIVRDDETDDYGWCTELNKEAFENNYTAYNWFNFNPENCLQHIRYAIDNWSKYRSTHNNTIDIKVATYAILKLKAVSKPIAGKIIAVDRDKEVFCFQQRGEGPQIFDFDDVESMDAGVRPYFDSELHELLGRSFIRSEDGKHFKAVGYTYHKLILTDEHGMCCEHDGGELVYMFVMSSEDNTGTVPVLKHIG